jgi:glycine/D-amino acid oxidase-like deaminating enzyme
VGYGPTIRSSACFVKNIVIHGRSNSFQRILTQMQPDLRAALEGSKHMPMWLDRSDRPRSSPALSENVEAELAVVGGGFTGLWAALVAKEAHPELDVVLIEAATVGDGASGRNGGFVSASLTHYQGNGQLQLPPGEPDMDQLGRQNAQGLLDTLKRYDLNVDFEPTGFLHVATEPYHVEMLRAMYEADQESGVDSRWLDREAVQQEVASPAFLAGHWTGETRLGILHPGRLADGLRRAASGLGVRFYENTSLQKISSQGAGPDVLLTTSGGQIRAKKVFLATNTFPSLLRQTRQTLVAPLWEYALATEPLSDAQIDSIAWARRQGLSGVENFFHYYRLTADNRIMIGGGSPDFFLNDPKPFVGQDNLARFEGIASYFFKVFPQLAGLRFSHRWSGPIGSSRDHAMHFGEAMQGRIVWVQGYNGLGVTTSRFGARAGLALLGLAETDLAQLAFVQRSAARWPPKFLRWLGANITFAALGKADRNQGKPGPWLKMLDLLGINPEP